jgi:arylsulfatase
MPGPAATYIAYGKGWANASNTPFRLYKHWVHEGGISTPLICHWPKGIDANGELRHQPGHLIDIMATCVDVAGAQYPRQFKGNDIQPMEGRSLVPAFAGRAIQRPQGLYWEHEGNRAVRLGKWKLVSKHPGGWELYDLERDRTEMHDLSAEHPEKVRELKALYKAWADRCGVRPWPLKKT